MIEESLYTLLAGIVTTSPGTVPDDTDPPYCVYSRISTVPHNVLEQAPGGEQVQFQIDLHATTQHAARTLANTVKAALQAASFGGYVTGDRDIYEPEVKLHRVVLEFDVFA